MLIALGRLSKEHARLIRFHEDLKSEGTCHTKAAFIFQPAHSIRKNETPQVGAPPVTSPHNGSIGQETNEGVIKVQLKLAALLPTPRSS